MLIDSNMTKKSIFLVCAGAILCLPTLSYAQKAPLKINPYPAETGAPRMVQKKPDDAAPKVQINKEKSADMPVVKKVNSAAKKTDPALQNPVKKETPTVKISKELPKPKTNKVKKEKPGGVAVIKKAGPVVQNEAQKMEVIEKITESKTPIPTKTVQSKAPKKTEDAKPAKKMPKVAKKAEPKKAVNKAENKETSAIEKPVAAAKAEAKNKSVDQAEPQSEPLTTPPPLVAKMPPRPSVPKAEPKEQVLNKVKIKTGEEVDVVISNKSFRNFKNNTVVRELSTTEKREPRGLGLKLPPHSHEPTRVQGETFEKRWTALKDSTVIDTLDAWSRRAGVTLVWNTNADYFVDQSLDFDGEYAEAVTGLLQSFENIPFRPVGQLFRDPEAGFDVLVIQSAE